MTRTPVDRTAPGCQPRPTCAFCGVAIRTYSRGSAALRACGARPCQRALQKWRWVNDPVWAEAERERYRRLYRRRQEQGLVAGVGTAVCPGCRRSFLISTLAGGACGGWWCPSGQDVAG